MYGIPIHGIMITISWPPEVCIHWIITSWLHFTHGRLHILTQKTGPHGLRECGKKNDMLLRESGQNDDLFARDYGKNDDLFAREYGQNDDLFAREYGQKNDFFWELLLFP